MKNIDSPTSIHLLKDQITAMEASLKHLSSIANGHMKTLNTLLNKGANAKPVRIAVPHVTQGKSLLEQLASSSVKAFTGGGANSPINQLMGGDSSASGSGGGSNISQGQMLGQLASAISRAMTRNL